MITSIIRSHLEAAAIGLSYSGFLKKRDDEALEIIANVFGRIAINFACELAFTAYSPKYLDFGIGIDGEYGYFRIYNSAKVLPWRPK